jgi:putative oxidoreductase
MNVQPRAGRTGAPEGLAVVSPLRDQVLATRDEPAVILIRLLVGLVVFFPEGLQKLLFPALLGAGRFASIGIPWPNVLGPFVGVVETVCGALIIIGLLTRVAVIPLIIVMIVAIVSTKIPILLGHDFLIFHLHHLSRYGFWSMQHEARADFCMLLGCLFLLIVGSGGWSLDLWWSGRRVPEGQESSNAARSP